LSADRSIIAAVPKASQLYADILAGVWTADNVAKSGRNVEDVTQMKCTVSAGARALREEFNWELNVANSGNFELVPGQNGGRISLERCVRGKPSAVPRDAGKMGLVSLVGSSQVDGRWKLTGRWSYSTAPNPGRGLWFRLRTS
jgi:hypothetical protein